MQFIKHLLVTCVVHTWPHRSVTSAHESPLTYDCINRRSPRGKKMPFRLQYHVVGSEGTAPRVYNLDTTELSSHFHAPARLSPGKWLPFSSWLGEHRAGLGVLEITKISCFYRVILSVLDPRKCEYLKDYSLDFEHAYLASWKACW